MVVREGPLEVEPTAIVTANAMSHVTARERSAELPPKSYKQVAYQTHLLIVVLVAEAQVVAVAEKKDTNEPRPTEPTPPAPKVFAAPLVKTQPRQTAAQGVRQRLNSRNFKDSTTQILSPFFEFI